MDDEWQPESWTEKRRLQTIARSPVTNNSSVNTRRSETSEPVIKNDDAGVDDDDLDLDLDLGIPSLPVKTTSPVIQPVKTQ